MIQQEQCTGTTIPVLDLITDRLLKKSNSAIGKLEENIKLTSSLRNSNSLISQIDTKIDGLTSNLQQYQFYLSQLNSLLIRSEFFEAQLNMLEAHNKLNSLRSSNGMPSLNDWKDEDLNWRTTEATLENLYLEYQYLTKQMEQLSDPQSFNSFIISQHDQQHQQEPEPQQQQHQPTLQDKMDNQYANLKPIRIVSKRERRRSMDYSKKKPIAQIPNLLKYKNQQELPTPDTTFDKSFNYSTDNETAIYDTVLPSNLTNNKQPTSRRNSHNKHTRCASLPESIVSSMLDTVRFTLTDDGLAHETKKDRKFNLRHFISHETGLKTKCLHDEEDEDVKDSEFLHSPVSIKLESYLKEHVNRDEPSKVSEEDIFIEPHEEEVTVFEHKLNRSNSCDSIFSMMKPEPLIPRDNTQQTMSWMKQFAKPQSSYAKESNVTTISINNLSSSISSPSRQALSNLVTQNTTNASAQKPQNKFPSLLAAKKSSPLAAPATTTTTTAVSEQSATVSSIPASFKRQLSVDDSSSYHSFESSYSDSQQHKQWSLLLNKFKPKNLMPSHSLVTSEVGKPIAQAQPIPISSTGSNSSHMHNHSKTLGAEKIKGSFSTLTIGPNRSKIVQHGESSTLGQSLVVSSKISHAALRDAIDSDFIFN